MATRTVNGLVQTPLCVFFMDSVCWQCRQHGAEWRIFAFSVTPDKPFFFFLDLSKPYALQTFSSPSLSPHLKWIKSFKQDYFWYVMNAGHCLVNEQHILLLLQIRSLVLFRDVVSFSSLFSFSFWYIQSTNIIVICQQKKKKIKKS